MTPLVNIAVPITKIVVDCALLMCVGFPILFLYLWGSAYQRGFFCDDESIRHPYHESTVASVYLYVFGVGMNVVVMLLTECFNQPKSSHRYRVRGMVIPNCIVNAYCAIGIFAFGAACSQLTTDVMKYTIGRYRPHFYTVCVPNVDCDDIENKWKYITEFNCTNKLYIHKKGIIKEMSLSFPSGHSSFSMYSMVYFAIYLNQRMTWDGSKLMRHTLQYLAVLAALFTAMTRISDYKHHWSDVLAGLFLGSTVAIITSTGFSNLFSKKFDYRKTKNDSSEMSNVNGNTGANV